MHRYDTVILDSRPRTAYLYGHMQHSQPLTIDRIVQLDEYGSNLAPDAKDAARVFGELGIDETKTVVIVGDYMDPSPARIFWTLRYFGHVKSYLAQESFGQMLQMGLDTTKSIYKPDPATFVPKPNESIRAYHSEIRNDTKQVLLDARSPQEFMAGHLPGAILLPFTSGVGTDGRMFQDSRDLERLFSSEGIPKNKEVICYCMHGHRASSLYCQLKIAGYAGVRLYDGSFVEWYGRRLPLE